MKSLVFATLAAVAFTSAAAAQPSSETLVQFVVPHERIDIDGDRKLNLFCIGSDAQTVLFDAEVAQHVRACSYDRAGLGYNDPATGPRSPMAIADDIKALIAAAKLKTPLMLVGHSLGGFNVKLYAAPYPEDVAGLVLVDPSEDRVAERVRTRLRRRFDESVAARVEIVDADWMRQLIEHLETCAVQAQAKGLDPALPTYKRCSDPVRPAVAAERAWIQVPRPIMKPRHPRSPIASTPMIAATLSIARCLHRAGSVRGRCAC